MVLCCQAELLLARSHPRKPPASLPWQPQIHVPIRAGPVEWLQTSGIPLWMEGGLTHSPSPHTASHAGWRHVPALPVTAGLARVAGAWHPACATFCCHGCRCQPAHSAGGGCAMRGGCPQTLLLYYRGWGGFPARKGKCWSSFPREKLEERWGCSAWIKEGSRETLGPLPVPKRAPRELERYFGQRHGMKDKEEWLPAARGQG